MKSQRKLHNWWLWCQDLAGSSCWEQWEGVCCRSQRDLVLPPKRSPAWALGTQGPLGLVLCHRSELWGLWLGLSEGVRAGQAMALP